ncbi:putative chitinase [Penicillium oxalicum 114-2]|uniref:chitinase n=1 Tax=Penicillium oxalicum (strain 114-2 / CGMCC 5302) TaxID=933388 RepID=S7ZQL5_PENO1|nr:putative chitinase [Penicillium oxalicum 114-2]
MLIDSAARANLTEINQTMDLLWRNTVDPSKVVMGMGFYGRSFTLSDPSCKSAGCPFSRGGNPGPCLSSAGTLMYSEVQVIATQPATVVEYNTKALVDLAANTASYISCDKAGMLQ